MKLGVGAMPEVEDELREITDKEQLECRKIIESDKYATIFDGHIWKMVNRAPIVLHSKDDQRIITQPYRPSPPSSKKNLANTSTI